MGETNFNLNFNGQIASDSYIRDVKQNICDLFKTDLAKVEPMFNGRTIVLKRNINKDVANKYKNMFDKTGAVSIIEPVSDFVCQLPPPSQPPVTTSFITCPKCGTAQEKTSTCFQCWVIFEKIEIHSIIQPADDLLPSQEGNGLTNIIVKGCWNLIRHAIPGVIIVLIALMPLIACFMVERWSGKEFAWLNISESKAIIAGRLGIESWNWNNLSDSAGTVFLSPEMNPIRVVLQFSHLQLSSRSSDRHFTYRLRLMDENGVAAFGKNGIQYLTAGKKAFANMLTGGDKSTELLGILNINRGGNYKISYDENDINDTGMRGFRTAAALILRRNMVVVPIHFFIISVALGIFLSLVSLIAKRLWL
jgi:hypothetical protein